MSESCRELDAGFVVEYGMRCEKFRGKAERIKVKVVGSRTLAV